MRKAYKSVLGVTSAAVIAAASFMPTMVYAWGDNTGTRAGRPSYTLDQINAGEIDNKITFNSISNQNVSIGDEKNFVGAKVAGQTVNTWNADTINVEDGQTYTIRLYVHNNNRLGEQMIAKGVKASFSLPTNVAKSHTIVGYLDSSNATPTRYWDEVTLNSNEDFYLEYVSGSAQYNNNVGVFSLSDNIILADGVNLGYTTMNGEIPGCYQYAGVVTINVKVHKSVGAELTKQVRIKGTKDWKESVEAKVGDEVEYQIMYRNLFADQVNNVMIRDILPTNVEYVANSTYLYNSNYTDGVLLKENTVATSGINIGSYIAKGNAYVRFTGKVVDKTMACGNNQLVNWASATVNGQVYKDDASVFVVKDDETCKNKPTPPTPTPDNPGSTPGSIVSTGPESIVLGALGAGAITTALGYYIASRKMM